MEGQDTEVMGGKTDERTPGDWKSRYDDKKVKHTQIGEAIYIFFIVLISFIALILNYNGTLEVWFCIPDNKKINFSRIFICAICGLLGGAIFDMKWFYKSIAHGFWNIDRIYWRIFAPIVSLSFAFCLACIFSENTVINGNGFSAATLGFLSGYFSDEAAGKMAEVAKVLFNTTKTSSNDTEENK